MKKASKSFSKQYPYLAYWIEEWGQIQITNGKEDSWLILIEEDNICYEDAGSKSIDEAFKKAEKHIRKVEAPDNFDSETIDILEENYKN
jgi:hypothetical protein